MDYRVIEDLTGYGKTAITTEDGYAGDECWKPGPSHLSRIRLCCGDKGHNHKFSTPKSSKARHPYSTAPYELMQNQYLVAMSLLRMEGGGGEARIKTSVGEYGATNVDMTAPISGNGKRALSFFQ